MKKFLIVMVCLVSSMAMLQTVCAAMRRRSVVGLPAPAEGGRDLSEAEKNADPYTRTLFSRLFASARGAPFNDQHDDAVGLPCDADDGAPAYQQGERLDDLKTAELICGAPRGIDEQIEAGLAWLRGCVSAGARGVWAYAPLRVDQKAAVEQIAAAMGKAVSRNKRTILTLAITSCVCILLQAGYSTEECIAWFADPINAGRVYACLTHLADGYVIPTIGAGLVAASLAVQGATTAFFGGGCGAGTCTI